MKIICFFFFSSSPIKAPKNYFDVEICTDKKEEYFDPRCTNWYQESKSLQGLKLFSVSDNFFNDSDFTSFCFSNTNANKLNSVSCFQVKLNFSLIGTIGTDEIDNKFNLKTHLILPQKKTV